MVNGGHQVGEWCSHGTGPGGAQQLARLFLPRAALAGILIFIAAATAAVSASSSVAAAVAVSPPPSPGFPLQVPGTGSGSPSPKHLKLQTQGPFRGLVHDPVQQVRGRGLGRAGPEPKPST
eukprot:1158011-Pelagomonas_calceolata.AAC.8